MIGEVFLKKFAVNKMFNIEETRLLDFLNSYNLAFGHFLK